MKLTERDKHKICSTLCGMKNRCNNPHDNSYARYGGRGITVCEEWMDKKNGHKRFLDWSVNNGYGINLSIDRIDNDKGYSPDNCRWATPLQQANNRRICNYVTINGVTKTGTQWAREIGISYRSFADRIIFGWKEDDLLLPPTDGNRYKSRNTIPTREAAEEALRGGAAE